VVYSAFFPGVSIISLKLIWGFEQEIHFGINQLFARKSFDLENRV